MKPSEPSRPQEGGNGRGVKAAGEFRTTREVAEALDLPPHVLRFWEARFPQVRPLKRAGGRRYYRPVDVDLLRRIREFLYQQGYTIKGVQKLLREDALRGRDQPAAAENPQPALFALDPPAAPPGETGSAARARPVMRTALEEVRRDLLEIRTLLDQLLADRRPPR